MATYIFLIFFLITTFALQWWQTPTYPLFIWITLGTLGSIGTIGTYRKSLLPLTLAVTLSFASVARTTHTQTLNTIDHYANGQRLELLGTIVDEPDKRPLQTKYTIAVTEVRTASGTLYKGIRGKVLVTDRRGFPQYKFGESVLVKGKLERPERIEDFRYDRYLSRYGIYSVMYYATLIPVAESRGSPLRGWLYSSKEHFESRINKLLPEPHASFMAGLLTGSRRGIPAHLLDDFTVTGLTHIIAISGYNITIVVSVITGLLFFVPVRLRFGPAVVAIVAFVIFVGASAAVVRAAIMGILGLLALKLGRRSQSRLAILWTACFMLLWNPKYLWYDAGFQLSFLAVWGLLDIGPRLAPLLRGIPNRTLREALSIFHLDKY